MKDFIVKQEYDKYSETDHQTWATLCSRQIKLQQGNVSKEYLEGFTSLHLDMDRVVNIEAMSTRLEEISGWTLVPVSGLIPTKDFFFMLINKKYPINVNIRQPHEIDFSEQPDIFHDACGHLPLLTNKKFTQFLTAYSIIALRYVNNERAIDFLGRLYWYTYEMGLINENGKCMPYGGAVITSSEEIRNVFNPDIPKYPFEIGQVFTTVYNPFKLQNEYFVINSFNDLFNCLEELENRLIQQLLLPEHDNTLRNFSMNKNIGASFNNVIGFLNDMQFAFPDAISFVSGQPDESYFQIDNHLSKFELFVDFVVKKTGQDRRTVVDNIGQYTKTKGIINDIIADYLRNDESIYVKGGDILMTAGAQEAFAVIVSTLCNKEEDVILTEDPSYIGLSSFARVFDYKIEGVQIDEEGIDLKLLKSKIIEINKSNKKVKLIYVIPDYQNPTGSYMPIGNRLRLLEMAEQYNFLIIEDNVYNSFTYVQKKNPTLKSLDRYGRVIYVGSFSKSLFPGLRVGMIAAEQDIENDQGDKVKLIDQMGKVKVQLSNNTSSISQAIVGGVLLDLKSSLSEWSKPKFESYKCKRDQMVLALDTYIKAYENDWAKGVKWNVPDGGFYIKMSLPFEVDNESVYECASAFNVIFCPIRYFYIGKGGENEIRLAFSNISLEKIKTGVQQLAAYIKYRTVQKATIDAVPATAMTAP